MKRMQPILLAMACLLLASCVTLNPFSKSDEQSVKLVLDVSAAENVNPDSQERPSPLEIRIFQLRSITEFQQADFFDLYKDNPLSASLLDTRILIMSPGEGETIPVDLDMSTQYVGVIAAFRDIDNAVWKDSIQIRDGRGFFKVLIGARKRMQLAVQATNKEIVVVEER